MSKPIAFERASLVVAQSLASFRLGLDADDPFAYTKDELLKAGLIVSRLWAEKLLDVGDEVWVTVESELPLIGRM